MDSAKIDSLPSVLQHPVGEKTSHRCTPFRLGKPLSDQNLIVLAYVALETRLDAMEQRLCGTNGFLFRLNIENYHGDFILRYFTVGRYELGDG